MKIYTFDLFWARFHYITKQNMLRKAQAKKLWKPTTPLHWKIKAFENIHKGINYDAYQYLKEQFKN